MSPPGHTIMSSQAEYLRDHTLPKTPPARYPETPQGYMYVQDLERLKARCDEVNREWRLFRAPVVYRGRTLVFGMKHLVRQCGQENVWFEEDLFPRLDQPIIAFHCDYHAQFEVEDVPNAHEQHADTSILIRSLHSEDLESFTAAESDRLAAAKFSRLLEYGRYEDWKRLLAIKIQREEAATREYAQWLEKDAKIRGMAALEARRQKAKRALQAQKADQDQRIRLLQEREAEEREKQKNRAFLERRQQEREQAHRQLTQSQLLKQLEVPAAPHSNTNHPQFLQPLSQQPRQQPQAQVPQSDAQQRAARLLQIMRDNSIARDSSSHQYSTCGSAQTQNTQTQARHAPTYTVQAASPLPCVRLPISNSPAPQVSPPRDLSFAQFFKPESRKRPASSMSNSSDTASERGVAKYYRGQSLERGQMAKSPELPGNVGFQLDPRQIELANPTASVRATKSSITKNTNNALLFALPTTLLETKMNNQTSLIPPRLTTRRPPIRFIGHDEHRYRASSRSPSNLTPKRSRLCKSYRTSSISIEMERYYQKMIEKLVKLMKLQLAWAYLQAPAYILDHITIRKSLDWIANRLQIGDYGAARYATVADALQAFLIMDFNQTFEFVETKNIRAGIQGDLSANIMKTQVMQARALDKVMGQWDQWVTDLLHTNAST